MLEQPRELGLVIVTDRGAGGAPLCFEGPGEG